MNTKALSEVYSIIQVMNINVRSNIPDSFMTFLRENRNILYNPKFDKVPKNFDNLEHDTQVIFALIFKKYFSQYNNLEIETNNSRELVKYRESFISKLLGAIKKAHHNILKNRWR